MGGRTELYGNTMTKTVENTGHPIVINTSPLTQQDYL